MPANKNALIRYKTIDNCLRNRYRRWTLEDLVEACSDALYEMEGISKGVSVRTVQSDIQIMRSDKLGYNAPIEVYDHKYYRYADDDYSIMDMPLSQNDYNVLQEAIDMLRQLEGFEQFSEMADVVSRLQDKLSITRNKRKPIIHFDSVPNLKGIRLLNPLYNYIAAKQTLRIIYQSFSAKEPIEFILCPYLLKEFRNRWFLFGSKESNMILYNLALDRIVSVEPIDVPYRENPNFDPEHFFDNVIGVSKNINSTPQRILFWANAEQSKYIKTKPVHPTQQVVEEDQEGCTFSIEVVINMEMYSIFLSYGPGVKIIYPRNVQNYMRDKLRQTLGLYGKEESPEPKESSD
ncbi:MAG: WYL domain-containing protein [Paludibacteraceae bacterium]|nr:WYL domain-containing protein [Paludibacteraceae bacterium]